MENFVMPPALFREQTFKEKMMTHKSVILIVIMQISFIFLFRAFAKYGDNAKPMIVSPSLDMRCTAENCALYKDDVGSGYRVEVPAGANLTIELNVPEELSELDLGYPMFQDVHVMIFIGFGFLMTFLKRYAYSAVCINLLLAAFVIQWHMLFLGFFEMEGTSFSINLMQMVLSEFCAGAVLISMGALLGKLSPFQYLAMAFFEVIFYTINEYIVFTVFKANDVGGSMNLHTFGAYFGLIIARIIYDERVNDHGNEKTVYYSNIFSIVGCLFLWIYWPSFNAMVATPDDARLRAVINTYYSLAACTLCTFATSAMLHRKTQFDMDLIQNATLAGGVAVGSAANLFLTPLGAVLTGSIAGCLSVLGFELIQPFLLEKIKLHDTCGVHNLHGMPGILGGLVSIVVAAVATTEEYGDTITTVFPAFGDLAGEHVAVSPNRSAGVQAAFQLAALVSSLGFAIVGGLFTGFLLKLPFWDNLNEDHHFFNDEVFFETTDNFAEMADMILDAVDERKRRSSVAVSLASSKEANKSQQSSDSSESDSENDDEESNSGSTIGNLEDSVNRRRSLALSELKDGRRVPYSRRGSLPNIVRLPKDAPASILNRRGSRVSDDGTRLGPPKGEPIRRMSVTFAAHKDDE